MKSKADGFRIDVGQAGKLALTAPEFITDPLARCQGIGVPLGYGGTYKGPDHSALVRFKTTEPFPMELKRETLDTPRKSKTIMERGIQTVD